MPLNKKQFKAFTEQVNQYNNSLKESNNPDYLPPEKIKCISDKILLYIRYGIYKCKLLCRLDDEEVQFLTAGSMVIYYKIRGKEEYTTRETRVIAASAIYIGAVINEVKKVTQQDIAQCLETTTTGIRNNYRRMKKLENL